MTLRRVFPNAVAERIPPPKGGIILMYPALEDGRIPEGIG